MPSSQLPAAAAALRLAPNTSYSQWTTYEAQAAEQRLVLNTSLQLAPIAGLTEGLTPMQMAETWPGRNFVAVFTAEQ